MNALDGFYNCFALRNSHGLTQRIYYALEKLELKIAKTTNTPTKIITTLINAVNLSVKKCQISNKNIKERYDNRAPSCTFQ